MRGMTSRRHFGHFQSAANEFIDDDDDIYIYIYLHTHTHIYIYILVSSKRVNSTHVTLPSQL